MNRKEAGNISLPLYAVIGVVLLMLFLGGLFISKQYIAGTSHKVATKTRQAPQQETAAEKKQKDLATRQKAAQQAQEAEATKKAADEKAQQAAQVATPQPAPTATSPAPQAVASTGPEDTAVAVLGVLCLAYAIYAFVRSRRALRERQHPSLT